MKWFREWRAWVRAEKERREESLIAFVIDAYEQDWNAYSKRGIAQAVIAGVRRQDREGVR